MLSEDPPDRSIRSTDSEDNDGDVPQGIDESSTITTGHEKPDELVANQAQSNQQEVRETLDKATLAPRTDQRDKHDSSQVRDNELTSSESAKVKTGNINKGNVSREY